MIIATRLQHMVTMGKLKSSQGSILRHHLLLIGLILACISGLEAKVTVEVGCYMMNIGNVRLGDGTFEADFFFFARFQGSNATEVIFTPRIVRERLIFSPLRC